MMERVQITGQAGDGQYYDNKGRLLYAMGDINITPGMWVWTNGKTIYGHQTAGEQPVLNFSNGVMPFISTNVNRYGGIGEINDNGPKAKEFCKKGYIIAYVGDEKHAYVQLANGEWFNVLTGESLGVFFADDACIGDDGSLLTVKGESGYYALNANANMPEIKLYYPTYLHEEADHDWPVLPMIIDGCIVEASKFEPYGGFISVNIPAVSYKTVKNSFHSGNKAQIIIRKNGVIVKTILLTKYAKRIENEAKFFFADIHNLGSGEESGPCYGLMMNGQIIGYGDRKYPVDFYHRVEVGPRIRPNFDYTVNISPDILRIYPDATIDGFIHVSVAGQAYPVFMHPEFSADIHKFPLNVKYAGHKQSVWDLSALPPPWYKAYRYYENVPDGAIPGYASFFDVTPRVVNKGTWISMNVYVSGAVRIADENITGIYKSVDPEPCRIPGPPVANGKITVEKKSLFEKYGLECTHISESGQYLYFNKRVTNISETSKKVMILEWPAGTGTEGMHYYPKTVSEYHENKFSSLSIIYSSSYYIGSGAEDPDVSKKIKEYGTKCDYSDVDCRMKSSIFQLDKRYSVKVTFLNDNVNGYADNITVYDNGQEIVTLKELRKYFPPFVYYWHKIRVGKLKNGIYAISLSEEYYPVIFVKDGKIINDINASGAVVTGGNTFTLKYFYSRLLLKKRLANLLGDV